MKNGAKTALVTGGAIRVGKAICMALSKCGYRLILHYGASEEEAECTAEAINSRGGRVDLIHANLADSNEAAHVIQHAVELVGKLDVLVNNAAIFLPGALLETNVEKWNEHMAVNVRAPFLLCREFSAHLPDDATGNIVNILDSRIFHAGRDHFAYRITKEALAAMTRNLAVDLAPRIRVNGVAPGAVLPPPGKDVSFLEALVEKRVPLKFAGSPEHVAAQVVHLLHSDFLTGVILPVDGGEFL